MSKRTKNPGSGGARAGAGRPPADDKASHQVAFRLTTAELAACEKSAKKAGYPSVHAYAKALLLGAK